jgi:hypothetical protein
MTHVRTHEQEKLTGELLAIQKNEYKVPEGVEPYAMVLRILDVLGVPDAELRDDLGYTVLSRWIYRQRLLTVEEMREVLQRVIGDEMLMHGLGERDTTSVFLRTFSSLVIVLVLLRDAEEEFLSREEIDAVVDRVVSYCEQEQDLRGYVEEGGWAHAAAHVADAVSTCVKHRYADAETCERLWRALAALMHRAESVYDAEEDERIGRAVRAMVSTDKIGPETLLDWLQQETAEFAGDTYRVRMIRRTNWKHLVRSLYFGLRAEALLGETEARWLELERGFNIY